MLKKLVVAGFVSLMLMLSVSTAALAGMKVDGFHFRQYDAQTYSYAYGTILIRGDMPIDATIHVNGGAEVPMDVTISKSSLWWIVKVSAFADVVNFGDKITAEITSVNGGTVKASIICSVNRTTGVYCPSALVAN